MGLLRPLLLAILGAFVAAAPMAPGPVAEGDHDAGTPRGHDQKCEDTSKGDPQPSALQTICGARVGRTGDGALSSEGTGDGAGPVPHTCTPPPRSAGAYVRAPAPTHPGSARAAADVRAGLRSLPPPAARRA